MKAEDLYAWLGEHTAPDDTIQLEVGGDGAIHSAEIRSVRVEGDVAILSTED